MCIFSLHKYHITLLRSVWTRTIVFQEYLFKNSKFSVRVVSQQAFVISQYACVVSQYAPFQKQIFLATETALDDAAHWNSQAFFFFFWMLNEIAENPRDEDYHYQILGTTKMVWE